MNAVTNFKSELRPLPMRISQLQFERLQAVRARDGLAIQEHVRRALDIYLKSVERDLAKAPAAELPGVVSTGNDNADRKPDGAQLADVLQVIPIPQPKRKSPPKVRQR